MASETNFTMRRLGDLAVFVNGDRGKNYPKEVDFVSNGLPFISAADIASGRLDTSMGKTISRSAFDRLGNGKVRKGDLLYCLRGSVGKSAIVTEQTEGAIASSLVIIRGNELADTRYIRYVLSSEFGQHIAKGLDNGSVQPNISVRDLKEVEVPAPSLGLQKDLVSFFGSLDSKIDLIKETNTTLEAIAQALFKSWFLDFDPVRAKTEGREPEGMDPATAALFPSEFEESELGLIPKGWEVKPLGELIDLCYGKAKKAADRTPGDVPVYGSGGVTGTHDMPLISQPTIIVGRKGSVGTLYWESRPCFPIDTVFYVKPKQIPLTFAFYAMQRLGLERMNTDAAVPGLNRDNAYRLPIVAPDAGTLNAWNSISSALRDRSDALVHQARLLGELRDTLLPRLISGKLRLPETEARIEEAPA